MRTIRYDDEFVKERGRETFFLQLKSQNKSVASYNMATFAGQISWFHDWGLDWELVAPRGWLGGNPGRYHVGFSGWDDPRLKLWCECFEDRDGRSLHPDKYVMLVYDMDQYRENEAKGLFNPLDWNEY